MVYEKSRANHLSLCLAVLFLLIGRFQCAEVEECSAVEGQTYTIKCSGNTTGDKRVLIWHLKRQKGSDLFYASCRDKSCFNEQPQDFSVSLQEKGTKFESALTINNVTKDLDLIYVECNVLDTLQPINTPAEIIKTCNLRVDQFINISKAASTQASRQASPHTNTSLYVLVASSVVAVIALTVLGTLLVYMYMRRQRRSWPVCHTCHSSSKSNHSRRSSHIYEDVNEESPHDNSVFNKENPEDNIYNKGSPEDYLSGCSDSTSCLSLKNTYPSVTKDDYENSQNHNIELEDTYITPCTPQSTPDQHRRTTTEKEGKPDSYYNESPRSSIGSDSGRRNSEISPAPDSPMVNPAGSRKDAVLAKRCHNDYVNASRNLHQDHRGNKTNHGHVRHKHREQKRSQQAAVSIRDDQGSDNENLLQPSRTSMNTFRQSRDRQSNLQDNARITGNVHYDDPHELETLNSSYSARFSSHSLEDGEQETVPKTLATQCSNTGLSSMVATIL